MNLRLLTVAALLGTACTSYAMDKPRKMPNADELKNRLIQITVSSEAIANKTDIIEKLADKELYPLAVITVVEKAIWAYQDLLDQTEGEYAKYARARADAAKGRMVEAILKEHPDALADLKRLGCYYVER